MHFRLADAAEDEHGNVKAAEGKDRVFILAAPGESAHNFISEEGGQQGLELVIRFEYRPATLTDWSEDECSEKKKPPAQKDLNALATKRILAIADGEWMEWIVELAKPHVMASGERTDYSRLEAHLRRYTARNTFDYFIHKDLGAFLRRELDFYIKNEVMHLDDVENESAPRVEQYLSKIKVIRKIAGKIIDFLAQLEDFQKKLWLKKKFVIETQYCIAVGSVPEAFYSDIAANNAQRDEWVKLFAIDEIKGDLATLAYSKNLKSEFLKAHPTLMVDTRHFDIGFTARLLETISDIDEQTDGVLFHSENFQALSLRVRPETLCRITEFSEHESNGRELDEGERVAVEVLPVLGQSAAAVEPGDGAFDHPTPGLDDEALHPIGSLDDLGLEIGQDAGQGAVKDRPLIGAVGEQFPEKGKQTEQGRQQRETAVAILNVGGGDDAVQQQALRIDQNMPLLALDQLAGIEAVAVDASPPFSALFTL